MPSFYLKRGNEHYLILGTTKSHERAMADVPMLGEIGSPTKINQMRCLSAITK